MKPTEALKTIFYRPTEVFTALQRRRYWFLVAAILIACVVLQALVIGLSMTRGFTDENQIRIYPIYVYTKEAEDQKIGETGEVELRSGPNSDDAVVNRVGSNQDHEIYMQGKTLFVSMSVFFSLVILSIKVMFDSIYFKIVGVIMKMEFGVRDWLAFSLWSRVPAVVITMFAIFLAVLALGERSDSNDYQVLAFAWWLRTPTGMSPFYEELIFQLDVALIWVIVLQTIGFREWSGRNLVTSLAVVLIPIAIGYGSVIWLLN